MNRLVLKTLLMSVITEIKFGQPLASNAGAVKKQFKQAFGLKPRATNEEVINAIGLTYAENGLVEDFNQTVEKFNVPQFKIEIVAN